ncbi:ATP-binding protein [uncultured Desulfobacter sp.]|uniref:ATP-binding protein n=1 Tax=uncultured Desulfobacter sp. TaxID=240139 RepID=UPI002AAA797B|nr:ATP-binding protein [uncultured Desulfobacter sp.]
MTNEDSIQRQVQQIAATLGANIQRYHDRLHELKRLAQMLFLNIQAEDNDIENWFLDDGFGIDNDGFWLSQPTLKAFREKRAPKDIISYSWHPDVVSNKEACFRMFALRNIGPCLKEIWDSMPGTSWIYYQDISNTSIQFPYIDQCTAITPEFDWRTYHTYQSVCPQNNPDGRIQWTRPTIDYAGEGLILSVSIPVNVQSRFLGLWSIDLPMKTLYPEFVFDTLLEGQVNFIVDRDGLLVAHPNIQTRIDSEKGSISQIHFHELGAEFQSLSALELLRKKSGRFELNPETDSELIGYYHAIPGIHWLLFCVFPRQAMEDVISRKIKTAFEKVKSGDFSYRLDGLPDIKSGKLVTDGFNEMADALEKQRKKQNIIQKEKDLLEERIRHYQKMEAIGTLAGGIAHDFNNVLFPIQGYAEMFLEELPKEDPKYEMANEIYRASSRAKELIEQILTFSRQGETKQQIVSFQIIIKEALKLLRSTIPKNIVIQQKVTPQCRPVFADPTNLHQVVMNLCTNAFHAVQENGGTIAVALEEVLVTADGQYGIAGLIAGDYIRLTVSDTGCGMDKSTLEQIFNPYFTTKKEGKGTGLGLSISYGIIKKLNGDIKVYSEPGKGTTFHVYIPVSSINKVEEPGENISIAKGTERILLIDDEGSIAQMGKKVLEKYGYHVSAFTSSIEALKTFEQDPASYDLILTDMTMPDMTGDILVQHTKRIKKDVPVIICTGFSENISNGNYLEKGADEFLMKPVAIHKLIGAIREQLDKSKDE